MSQSTLRYLVPAHHILNATLLGSCLWGSFIAGVIAYKTLPRQQFGNLQAKTFPLFFSFNNWLSLGLLTNWLYIHPGTLSAILSRKALGISKRVLDNTYVLAFGYLTTNILNRWVVLPYTRKLMYQRHKLERKEGKAYTDPNPSPEMRSLTKQFSLAHSASSLVNLAYLGALLYHTTSLANHPILS